MPPARSWMRRAPWTSRGTSGPRSWLEPRHAFAWLNRALASERLGDVAGALVCVDRALVLEPGSFGALRTRGLIRTEMGDVSGAIEDLERALARSPSAEDRRMLEERL